MKTLITLSSCLLVAAPPVCEAKPRPYVGHKTTAVSSPAPPASEVRVAMEAARVRPAAEAFANANQVYAYADNALFQVYTSVGKVTDIVLQPGERLVGAGPVAAGDTARWIIGDTESGTGDRKQVHILIKPTLSTLSTNLVVNTDRRTYHIELTALRDTYMACVSWRYPQDELLAVQRRAERIAVQAPLVAGIDPEALEFGYRIDGARVPWRPVRAFDDGHKVFIELPADIGKTDLPPLFLVGGDGKAELVNYRIAGKFLIVDRLFSVAELKLGDRTTQKTVQIKRVGIAKS
ncbi:hypothetical protein MMA231_04167 (plasmid) [Asticcacaulis sp. MM231]|uniref:P-type conjugative transfer protein TrbG n=1 Tax=Asticcacaulis sp. MM231 TaxID=3157666 RepID=UPI0032D59D29